MLFSRDLCHFVLLSPPPPRLLDDKEKFESKDSSSKTMKGKLKELKVEKSFRG